MWFSKKWYLLATLALVFSNGCNTLSALGLPTGSNANRILKPAKSIANHPSQPLLQSKELATAPLSVYVVEIGDSILIEPVKFDTTIRLPGDQIVQPDGMVSLGQFGRLLVANKTIEQIESEAQQVIDLQTRQEMQTKFDEERREQIRQRRLQEAKEAEEEAQELPTEGESDLEFPLENPDDSEEMFLFERRVAEAIKQNKISARLVSWDSKKIYVLGEVNSPGFFPFIGNENVLDGIIEAGGLTSRANHHEIIVARPTTCGGCREVMKVCYDQIVQLGDSSTNYQLRPGDRIFVPSLTFCDDLKQTLAGDRYTPCPRCSSCPETCNLPQGCE
jgi:polysaccharide export outer membrane protein